VSRGAKSKAKPGVASTRKRASASPKPASRKPKKKMPGAGNDPGVWSEDEVRPFWETKRLDQMSPEEWDALCDGCGQCCLVKIEDEDTGSIFFTRLSCSLLDTTSCRCKDYENRFAKMPDCLKIDLKKVRSLKWLPESCAYRRLDEGRGLAWWHPLISGDPDTIHQAGVSVRGWVESEEGIPEEEIARYIIGEST
jgi:uncharacterized cysteine cluster protein YcgN (CxxCxxCC family)